MVVPCLPEARGYAREQGCPGTAQGCPGMVWPDGLSLGDAAIPLLTLESFSQPQRPRRHREPYGQR